MKNSSPTYEVKKIGKAYNEEMLKILRDSPIKAGGLDICFDRSPDIFKMTDLKHTSAEYLGFFKEGKLLGFIMIGYYQAYMFGKSQRVFHITDLYVKKTARNRGFFYKASSILFANPKYKTTWGYSIIMQGNKNAESHISRRHEKFPHIPYSKIIGNLDVKNILITFKMIADKQFMVRKARLSDVDSIVDLLQKEFSGRLLAPSIDKDIFLGNLLKRPDFGIENYYIAERDGNIVGVCAAWNCNAFKQNRLIKLGRQLKTTKLLYNILSLMFKLPPLPMEGKAFKEVYITDYATINRDPKIMKALLCKIYNEYRKAKYNTMIWGSYEDDKLLKATKGFFRQSVKSHIILASTDKKSLDNLKPEECKPYVDVALL